MKILVIQHLPVEHPGIFRDLLRRDGLIWDTVELDRGDQIPPLEPYAFLLVMGGPQDVWQEDQHPWLAAEKAAIRRFVVEMRRPSPRNLPRASTSGRSHRWACRREFVARGRCHDGGEDRVRPRTGNTRRPRRSFYRAAVALRGSSGIATRYPHPCPIGKLPGASVSISRPCLRPAVSHRNNGPNRSRVGRGTCLCPSSRKDDGRKRAGPSANRRLREIAVDQLQCRNNLSEPSTDPVRTNCALSTRTHDDAMPCAASTNRAGVCVTRAQ